MEAAAAVEDNWRSAQPPYSETENPSRYAWYVVVLLMLTYTLSYIDRKLPFILMEAIKAELKLSDTQVGLLTGIMFSVVYATAGIPLASLADRRSRKRIIGWAVLLWSGATAIGSMATGFWQLALTRMGVAAGEAACSPAAHSLIADYISPRFRARAIGLYLVGSQAGILLGLAVGGWINEFANWRIAMLAIAAPGLLIALLVLLTLREPPRKPDATLEPGAPAPTLLQAIKAILAQPTLVHLLIAATLTSVTTGAFQGFAPAYIIRTFRLGTAEVGLTYGLTLGLAGVAGILLGGLVGDRLQKDSAWKALVFVAAAASIGTVALVLGFLAHAYVVFLTFIFVMQVGLVAYGAPCFATLQLLLGARMHAVASGILLFCVSGIGLSVGPFLTGILSDLLAGLGTANSLKWALVILVAPGMWAGAHFLAAAFHLRATTGSPAVRHEA